MKKTYMVGIVVLVLLAALVTAASLKSGVKAANLKSVFPYGDKTAQAIKNGELLLTIDLNEGWNSFTYDSRYMPPVEKYTELKIIDGENIYTYSNAVSIGLVNNAVLYWCYDDFDEIWAWCNLYNTNANIGNVEYKILSYKPNLKLLII